MRILRARDRVASPWKNGGGTTTEIAVFPAGSDFETFGWRVSAAQVARGGPFSAFPGIDRKLAILQGRMSLEIAGLGSIDLSPDSPLVQFSGDAATSATVLQGPVMDLNVMTRRGAFSSRMTRQGPEDIIDPVAVTLLFALGPARLAQDGREISLAQYDTAILEPGGGAIRLAGADIYRIEIAAQV
jgi:uncharacterized protein